jgi:benzoate/toluate 1,2-dioxygenase alpha subunit
MSDVWENNTLNLAGSRVIDRSVYVEPDIYKAEIDRVFAKTWQWIAHDSEMPDAGDYVSAIIAGRSVVVTRNKANELNAFYNTCTHRGAALTEKTKGNCGDRFVCMYHGWTFDTAGKLIGAPWPKAYGPDFNKSGYDIPTISLDTHGGNIFVCLDPDVAPLTEFLGEAAPYIESFTGEHEALGRVRWMIDGNWKLWHENFRDNYHPEFTHNLVGTGYRGVKVAGRNLDLPPAHGLLAFPMQRDSSEIEKAMNKIGGLNVDLGNSPAWARPPFDLDIDAENRILAVFPNLDFQNMAAGGILNMLQVLRPLSVDRTVVEALVFGPKGESAEARQWRLERSLDTQAASGKVSGDDNEAVRRCSLGFTTLTAVRWSNMDRGQAPGREGLKNDEYSLRAFYAAYKEHMGDAISEGGESR